MFRVIC